VKVAGSPSQTPPAQDTGSYNTGAYDAGSYDAGAYDAGAYDAEGYDSADTAADGHAAVSYDMGAPYGEQQPVYGPDGGLTGAGAAAFDPTVTSPDLGVVGRTPPAGGNKRLIRFAAVAAAVAVVGGGGVAWAVTGGSSPKPQASAEAKAQPPGPAPLTDAQRKDAEDKRQKELKKRASRAARDEVVRPSLLARGTPPPTKKPDTVAAGTAGDPVPASAAQAIARAMLPDFGWSPSSQFGCLVNLWNKESHWNTHASNPSGAYGIPQALPGSKMASAGPDWQNDPRTQIKWGMGYIKDRYSSPCDAWSHSESTGWY
jgi:hypothetical protein